MYVIPSNNFYLFILLWHTYFIELLWVSKTRRDEHEWSNKKILTGHCFCLRNGVTTWISKQDYSIHSMIARPWLSFDIFNDPDKQNSTANVNRNDSIWVNIHVNYAIKIRFDFKVKYFKSSNDLKWAQLFLTNSWLTTHNNQ